MAGHRFVVSGDPVAARNTVYNVLINQGFTLKYLDEWSAKAQRGSSGVSVALGALAGTSGRHIKLNITCQSAPDGFVITLAQGTSGISGGVIGMAQAERLYTDVYNTVGTAFQNAGILISGGNI